MQIRIAHWLAAAALVAGAAQAQMPKTGSLLVATAELDDRNFTESVLLVLHHDEDGSLGILVNRPTNLQPADVFPELPELERYSSNLFLGGPVSPNRLLVLFRAPSPGLLEGPPVVDDVYVSADPELLGKLSEASIGDASVRLYAGHAAWGPGQLEAEIEAGDWHVVSGRADLVFSAEPLGVWRRLARGGSPLVVDSAVR